MIKEKFIMTLSIFLILVDCSSATSSFEGTKEPAFSSGACGIKKAVRVTSVADIPLSQPTLLEQETAEALAYWVKNTLKPAARKEGLKVTEIWSMVGYACRNRVGVKRKKLSEHALGKAIDIGGFTLSNGDTITVLNDYYGKKYSDFFKSLRKGACGPFGTVLGPGTNAAHRNHFHFDTASYRNGNYCK